MPVRIVWRRTIISKKPQVFFIR